MAYSRYIRRPQKKKDKHEMIVYVQSPFVHNYTQTIDGSGL
jgi:hypothetical protein